MPPATVEVISALNLDTHEPLLNECKLIIGDGSTKIAFSHGRALVPVEIAQQLADSGRSDLSIPALGYAPGGQSHPVGATVVGGQAQAAESLTREGLDVDGELSPDELESIIVRAQDALARLREAQSTAQPGRNPELANAGQLADPEGTVRHEPAPAPEPEPEPEAPEEDPAITLAKEHLRSEGEDVPEPEPEPEPEPPAAERVIPAGFADKTAEGESRCLAKTAAGKQCQNAAVADGPACTIAAHAKQFQS